MTPKRSEANQTFNPGSWAWRITAAVCVAAVAVAITVVGSSERAALSVVGPATEEFAATGEQGDSSPIDVQPEDELTFSYESGVDNGSSPMPAETFSYQASLEVAGGHVCGATLIAQQFVLTAASCVRDVVEGQLSVRLGAQNQLVAQTELLPVADTALHPDARVGHGPDLAVVRLAVPAKAIFRPVAIPSIDQIGFAEPASVQLSGWGRPHLSTRATSETFANVQGSLAAEADACLGIGELLEAKVTCVGNNGGDELCLATDLGGPVVAGGLDPYSVGTIGYGNRCQGLLVATPTADHREWILGVIDDPFVGFGSP